MENKRQFTKSGWVDWSILRNFHVFSVTLICFLYSTATSSHYAFCGALVQQNGLDKKSVSYLLPISGISDIIGNIALGILFDVSWIRRRITQCYCLIILIFSAVILTIPFLNMFSTMCLAFALWGAFAASNTTKNVLLCEYVNKEQLADAVGFSLVAMALGYGTGPFLTGKHNIFPLLYLSLYLFPYEIIAK